MKPKTLEEAMTDGIEKAMKKRGPGNPKASPWYSTPARKRKKPMVNVTLSPEAHQALDELATKTGKSRSQVIEGLVLTAYDKMIEPAVR